MPRHLPTALLALTLVSACSEPDTRPIPEGTLDPRSMEFARALGVDFSEMRVLPSGLWIGDDLVGTGAEAGATSNVTVHYTGYHPDGRTFDSSRPRGEPFGLILGQNPPMVIQGWEQGIPGMRVGGRRILVIPPHLGYGERGAGGVIPPNAVLVFHVELLSAQ